MVRRFLACRSSVNYKRSIRRWLPVERTIKVVRANLICRGRERVRENWEFLLRYVSEHLQVSSFLSFAAPPPPSSLSFSLLHLFYLELYMPQFRICVKQCAKLYGIVARWIVSRSDKPDKNSNLWIFKVRLNRVNFSRNIGKWFIGPPLYFLRITSTRASD